MIRSFLCRLRGIRGVFGAIKSRYRSSDTDPRIKAATPGRRSGQEPARNLAASSRADGARRAAQLLLPPAPEARMASGLATGDERGASNPDWLTGCGMLMWAPPFEIEDELREVLSALGSLLHETDPATGPQEPPSVEVYYL